MKDLLEEIINTLEHAKVFISSKEKMHPTGQQLYQETVDKVKDKYKVECETAEIMQLIKQHEEIVDKANEEIKDDLEKC